MRAAWIQGGGNLNDITVTADELGQLRRYLAEWVEWQWQWRPALGFPGVCGFARGAKTETSSASEYLERSDKWAMELIDAAIDDLMRRPDGPAMRCALRATLLNEAVGVKVFRHGRLMEMTPEDVELLADRAEREMVLICKAKGLPL